MGVHGSGSGIIARLEEGRVLCFGLFNELSAGHNRMIVWQDWRNEWMGACTTKDDDASDDQVLLVDSLVVASDNNLSSIRITMLVKLELSIQCILKLILGWVKVLLNVNPE